MDLIERMRRNFRVAVGLDPDPGSVPVIDRLAFYRARVLAAAADGSTVDVQPEDPRVLQAQGGGIPQMSGVPLLVPAPLQVLVLKAGSLVHLGWERGDPSRPRALPIFDGSAGGVAKLVLSADTVQLGQDSGDAVVTRKDLRVLYSAINGAAVVAQDGGASLKAAILAALAAAGWTSGLGDGKCGSSRVFASR